MLEGHDTSDDLVPTFLKWVVYFWVFGFGCLVWFSDGLLICTGRRRCFHVGRRGGGFCYSTQTHFPLDDQTTFPVELQLSGTHPLPVPGPDTEGIFANGSGPPAGFSKSRRPGCPPSFLRLTGSSSHRMHRAAGRTWLVCTSPTSRVSLAPSFTSARPVAGSLIASSCPHCSFIQALFSASSISSAIFCPRTSRGVVRFAPDRRTLRAGLPMKFHPQCSTSTTPPDLFLPLRRVFRYLYGRDVPEGFE